MNKPYPRFSARGFVGLLGLLIGVLIIVLFFAVFADRLFGIKSAVRGPDTGTTSPIKQAEEIKNLLEQRARQLPLE